MHLYSHRHKIGLSIELETEISTHALQGKQRHLSHNTLSLTHTTHTHTLSHTQHTVTVTLTNVELKED